MAFANRLQKDALSGQVDLFGMSDEHAHVSKPKLSLEKPATVFNSREQLLWERELLGLYLSQHPLSMYEQYLAEQTMPLQEIKPEHDGKSVTIGGAITDVREIMTKNGQKMAFVKLEDQFGEVELILFPNAYQQTTGLWERDRVVLVRGKVSAKDREGNLGEEVKIMVDDAREITAEQAQAYKSTGKKRKVPAIKKPSAAAAARKPPASAVPLTAKTRVYIRLKDGGNEKLLMSLKQAIDENTGDTEVVLVLGTPESKQIIKLPMKMKAEDSALEKLRELAGSANIKLQ